MMKKEFKKNRFKKQSFLKRLGNSKGFSIVELMVVAGFFAALTYVSSQMIVNLKKTSVKSEQTATSKQNEEFLNYFIYKTLTEGNIDISFGVLNIPDDNNKNLLAVLPDYPSTNLTDANKKRTFTLAEGKKTSISFLASKTGAKKFYPARVRSYEVSSFLTDPNENLIDSKFSECHFKKELSDIWKFKGLALLYVPAFVRDTISINPGTLTTNFPKKPAFLGRMSGLKQTGNCNLPSDDESSTTAFKKFTGLATFSFNNPSPGASGDYTNVSDFTLKAHMVSGEPVIYMAQVEIFSLALISGNLYHCVQDVFGLNVTTCDGDSGALIAENVKELKFIRNDIASTQMRIEFTFNEIQ